jgi:cytochrome c-type biogenesis protein CcmH
MKTLFFVFLLLATPLLCSIAPIRALAAPAPGTFADPAMEARARNLQRQLRCLVCQGESIDESQASLAAEMRDLVRQQISEGRSDKEIEQFLTSRYGNFILMRPPVETDTYFLWAAPFLVLIGAAGVAILVIRRARQAVPPL